MYIFINNQMCTNKHFLNLINFYIQMKLTIYTSKCLEKIVLDNIILKNSLTRIISFSLTHIHYITISSLRGIKIFLQFFSIICFLQITDVHFLARLQ